MENFVKKIEKWTFNFEMVVDWKIFDKKTILRAAYELVDKVYMFFKKDGDDFVVQFKLKDEKLDMDGIVDSFWEELVFHDLRSQIDKKTGKMKERIMETALGYGLTLEDVKLDLEKLLPWSNPWSLDWWDEWDQKQKSIDEIMKEIESDPDFEDDKDEILWILKEIEEDEMENKKEG